MAQHWRLWSKIIHSTFATAGSLTLQQLLGPWIENYNTDYHWTQHICTSIFNLYHSSPHRWNLYWPDTIHCTYVQYTHHPNGTSALIPTTPVTPVLHSEYIEIKLPLTPVHAPAEPPRHQIPLLIWLLTTPPATWEQPLWYQIKPHANLYTLHEQIGQGQSILLVSNASVNHCNHRTCTWILYSKTKCWSGEGITPSHTAELNSGLAEA